MSLVAPIEIAQRAQRRAADPAASVWVSASAGSGKTKLLTDRLLRLMLTGARPDRIQCLTFTKAAAAEMAVGAGAGLLLADQLGKGARQRLGIIALVAGLAATVLLLIGAGVRVNRELGEGRRTRRRLETIRHDSGFPEDGDFY